jgi:hypothetical protein
LKRNGRTQPGFKIRCGANDEIAAWRKTKDRFLAGDAAKAGLVLKDEASGATDRGQHSGDRIGPSCDLNDRKILALAQRYANARSGVSVIAGDVCFAERRLDISHASGSLVDQTYGG